MNAICGKWGMHGTTLAPDGSTLYEWDADMLIEEQDGATKIVMETKGGKSSRSISYAEKLTVSPEGETFLRYGYEADPDHPSTADHDFFGLTQLTFAADQETASGTSCNYNGRYVIMQLALRRL